MLSVVQLTTAILIRQISLQKYADKLRTDKCKGFSNQILADTAIGISLTVRSAMGNMHGDNQEKHTTSPGKSLPQKSGITIIDCDWSLENPERIFLFATMITYSYLHRTHHFATLLALIPGTCTCTEHWIQHHHYSVSSCSFLCVCVTMH